MAEIDSGSGNISFGGLSSNLDTNKIVAAMVEAQRRPMAKIEEQQAIVEAHKELLSGIASKVRVLGEVARSMESLPRLLPQHATSSNDGVVRASAGEGAKGGVYYISVERLARASRALSAPVATKEQGDATAGGNIRWQSDGRSFAIEVAPAMSLQEICDGINRVRGGLLASILHDGNGYRLSLIGTEVGAAHAISVSDTTSLRLGDPSSLLVEAQDAAFVVDRHISMTRSTNVVNDAIEGVTLRLEAQGDEQTIFVAADSDHLIRTVEQFVEAYNDVRDAIDAASRPTRDYEKMRLVGDSALRNLADTLQRTATAAAGDDTARLRSLAAIGINSDKEGRLHFDHTVWFNAVAENASEVARLFARDHRSGSKGVAGSVARICEQFASPLTGTLVLKMQSMSRQQTAADGRLAQMQNNLDRYEQTTRKKFTELERTMTIMKAQNDKLQQQMRSLQRKD